MSGIEVGFFSRKDAKAQSKTNKLLCVLASLRDYLSFLEMFERDFPVGKYNSY